MSACITGSGRRQACADWGVLYGSPRRPAPPGHHQVCGAGYGKRVPPPYSVHHVQRPFHPRYDEADFSAFWARYQPSRSASGMRVSHRLPVCLPHICLPHYHISVCLTTTYLSASLPHICLPHYHIPVCLPTTYLSASLPHICLPPYRISVCLPTTYLSASLPHTCLPHYHIPVCLTTTYLSASLPHI